jgi:hypothetical protein
MKNASSESAEIGRFLRDERGSVMLEFTVTMWVFLLALFGVIEFSHLFYQWNIATKAVQHGARLAAVSNPVPQGLVTLTGLEGGAMPGDPMPAFDFTCTGYNCAGGNAAMDALVYGLNDTANGCTPDSPPPPRELGMCDIFDRITPQNVVVRYQYTGLGYAGRPGGAVPTITVSLTGLNFNFYFLNGLLALGPIPIPGLNTTITGEDLNVNGT